MRFKNLNANLGLLYSAGKEWPMSDGGQMKETEAKGGLKTPAEMAQLRKGRAEELRAAGFAHTLSLDVRYNGAPFAGFACQPQPTVKTVQGELERALSLLFRRDVATVCAGRTDAGVHALGQVVSFDLTEEEFAARSPRSFVRSMNALVDDAISVAGLSERPLGFSARFDALSREYHYHICTDAARPVLLSGSVWHLPGVELDLDAMNLAARNLVGEHDFKSFCMAASAQGKPTFRNVMELEVHPESIMGTDVVTVRVVGNAFLHSMVRTIVGTLVEVGRGRREPAWTAEVLAACNRCAAGQNAPANGLVFWNVTYGDF